MQSAPPAPLTPSQKLLARQITEAELLRQVRLLAERRQWRLVHFNDSRRQAGGALVGDADAKAWPDVVLIPIPANGRHILVRELKGYVSNGKGRGRRLGKMGDLQPEMLAWLTDAGTDARRWTPDDWIRGDIDREMVGAW